MPVTIHKYASLWVYEVKRHHNVVTPLKFHQTWKELGGWAIASEGRYGGKWCGMILISRIALIVEKLTSLGLEPWLNTRVNFVGQQALNDVIKFVQKRGGKFNMQHVRCPDDGGDIQYGADVSIRPSNCDYMTFADALSKLGGVSEVIVGDVDEFEPC